MINNFKNDDAKVSIDEVLINFERTSSIDITGKQEVYK